MNERFGILTYEEFRMLQPAQQRAYVGAFRDFVVELSKKGETGETDEASLMRRMMDRLLEASVETAEAADVDCGNVSFYQNGSGSVCYRVGIPGSRGASEVRCGTQGNAEANGAISRMAAQCQPQARAFTETENRSQGGYSSDSLEALHKGISDPDAASGRSTSEVAAGAAQPLDPNDEEGTGDGAAKATAADKDSLKKRDEAVAAETKTNAAKDTACLYAGFVIDKNNSNKGKKCTGLSKWTTNDGKTTYSCIPAKEGAKDSSTEAAKGDGAPAMTSAKVIRTSDPKAGSKICNPLLYGLKKAGDHEEPICVKPGKNASQACLDAVKGDKSSLESARKVLEDNKEDYNKLQRALTKVCNGKSLTSEASAGRSATSKTDLAATCELFSKRLNEVKSAGGGSEGEISGGTQ